MARIIVLSLLIASGTVEVRAWGGQQAAMTDAPVAIVARVRGEVTAELGPTTRTLRLFERLTSGETIRTARGAEIVVVFRTGSRVRLGEASRARLGAGGATSLDGTLETLAPTPPLPLVAPVAGAGTTTAAVRIRGRNLAIAAPPVDTATLADATVLEFTSASVDAYDVEIEDASAAVIFRSRARETVVTVPPGVLQPGTTYRWRVTARLPTGFAATGEGRFYTLGSEAAVARAQLRSGLTGTDAESLGLLAEVDRTLGLWREALSGFRAARAAGSDDTVIAERIAELERRAAAPSAPAPGGR